MRKEAGVEDGGGADWENADHCQGGRELVLINVMYYTYSCSQASSSSPSPVTVTHCGDKLPKFTSLSARRTEIVPDSVRRSSSGSGRNGARYCSHRSRAPFLSRAPFSPRPYRNFPQRRVVAAAARPRRRGVCPGPGDPMIGLAAAAAAGPGPGGAAPSRW
eukprot:760539-Hanusia_phi.AAC.5